jgi:RHS repeat-associated protein
MTQRTFGIFRLTPYRLIFVMSLIAIPGFGQAAFDNSPIPTKYPADLVDLGAPENVSVGQNSLNWSASPNGAFSYTIPIEIPPGRRGMQPKLSLEYNSFSGNGIAGMGWLLSGIPTIMRVNNGNGINYLGADSFGVNFSGWGAPVEPSKYLVDTEVAGFHTAQETWGNYQPNGKCGDGPCYWVLRDGTGNTWYFGGDSDVHASSASAGPWSVIWERNNGNVSHRGIFAWALYKVVDGFGNSYKIEYGGPVGETFPTVPIVAGLLAVTLAIIASRNRVTSTISRMAIVIGAGLAAVLLPTVASRVLGLQNGTQPPVTFDGSSFYPIRIVYSTNQQRLVTTNEVLFDYERRPDITPAPYLMENRLKNLTIKANTSVVRRYVLDYTASFNGVATGRSLLSSVQVLGSDLKPESALPPISFAYQPGQRLDNLRAFSRVAGPRPQGGGRSGDGEYLVGDINGDGRQDIVSVYQQADGREINYSLGSESGLGQVVSYFSNVDPTKGGYVIHGNWHSILADVNGDGKDDLVLVQLGPGEIATTVAFGTQFGLGPLTDSGNALELHFPFEGDDGNLVCINLSTAWCNFQIFRGDINYDGITDIVFIDSNGPTVAYALSTPEGLGAITLLSQTTPAQLSFNKPLVGDFNGDGKSDVLTTRLSTAPVFYSLGTESGLSDLVTDSPNFPPGASLPIVADINGDQRSDIVFPWSPSEIGVLFGGSGSVNGLAGTFATMGLKYIGGGGTTHRAPSFLAGDLNGDGITDLILDAESATSFSRNNTTVFLGSPDGQLKSHQDVFESPFVSLVADIVGDGRAEVLFIDPQGGNTGLSYSVLTSSGQLSPPASLAPIEPVEAPRVFPADLNGDGIPDLVLIPAPGGTDLQFRIILSSPAKPDLLTSVRNGLGGTLGIEYSVSTSLPGAVANNVSTCGRQKIPPPGPADCGNAVTSPRSPVKRVARYNGRGQVESTAYSYYNGRYVHRKGIQSTDLGFQTIEKLDEVSGGYQRTFYRQDLPFQLMPSERQVFSAQDDLMSDEWFTYEAVAPYVGVESVRLTAKVTQFFEKEGWTNTDVRESYQYGNFGVVARSTECKGTACTTTIFQHSDDPARWILGRLDAVQTIEGDGSFKLKPLLLNRERLFYVSDQYASRMLLKMRERLLCDEAESCICISTNDCDQVPPSARWVPIERNLFYDNFGNVSSVEDALGHRTIFKYDPDCGQLSNRIRVVRHGNQTIGLEDKYSFDFACKIATVTDPNHAVTKYIHDALGRTIRIEHATGGVERFDFSHIGDPMQQYVVHYTESATGDPQIWTKQFFDGIGVLFAEQKKGDGGSVITRERSEWVDANRKRVLRYTKPHLLGEDTEAVEIVYEAGGRPDRIYQIDGSHRQLMQQFTYHPREVITTDSLNHSITHRVDTRGLPVLLIDSVGQTGYEYDAAERLKTVFLANGQKLRAEYDSWGRPRSIYEPTSGKLQLAFDDVNNKTSTLDSQSRTITYAYDELNRIRYRTDSQGKIQFRYDDPLSNSLGRLSGVDDHGSTTSFVYDSAGNLTSRVVDVKGYQHPLTVSYVYDSLNRRIKKTFSDGRVLIYTYTDGGNLESLQNGSGATIATFGGYNALGKIGFVQTPAANTTYEYRPEGLVGALKTQSPTSVVLQDYRFVYDPIGNISEVIDKRPNKGTKTTGADDSQRFWYDGVYRLRKAVGSYGTMFFSYDPVGNITRNGNTVIKYQNLKINAFNPMTGDRVLEIYDKSGNLRSKKDLAGEWTYTYDDNNQLTSANRDSRQILEMSYDFSGQRLTKIYHPPTGGTVKTRYLDGYEERQNSLDPAVFSTTMLVDAFNLGLVGTKTIGTLPSQPSLSDAQASIGNPFSGNTNNGPVVGDSFLQTSVTGSSVVVASEAGQALSRLLYHPFGSLDTKHSVGLDVVTPKFAGKEFDEEIGLAYFGARYYDPELARFTSADSRAFLTVASHPQDLNRYAYVRNNPFRYRDPSGLEPLAANQSWTQLLWDKIHPDYMSVSITVASFGIAVSMDRSFNIYAGISAGVGSGILDAPVPSKLTIPGGEGFYWNAPPTPPDWLPSGPQNLRNMLPEEYFNSDPAVGVSVTASRIFDIRTSQRIPDEYVGNFVSGVSEYILGCYNFCGGLTRSGDRFSLDTGVGLGAARKSAGMGAVKMWKIFESGLDRHIPRPDDHLREVYTKVSDAEAEFDQAQAAQEAAAAKARAEAEQKGQPIVEIDFSENPPEKPTPP